MSMDPKLMESAAELLDKCRAAGLKIVTAESCTGGLIAAYLTEIPGASHVLERGFVAYSNTAKSEQLGVPVALIATEGAVSEGVVRAMAEGALAHSHADLSIAVSGIAGPGGGSAEKPVGLVHMAAARKGNGTVHRRCDYGDIGRGAVRERTVADALALLASLL
jgi:nicotinamide-nucleotide amidase